MQIIDIIQSSKLASLNPSGFNIFWHTIIELKNFGLVDDVCNQLKPELCELIRKCAKIENTFHCTTKKSEFSQVCFGSSYQIFKEAKIFLDQGLVIACDDLSLWQHLQYSHINKAYLPYDWLAHFYKYLKNKNNVNALNMLNHPFLNQDNNNLTHQYYEYGMRSKNIASDTFDDLLNINNMNDLPPNLKNDYISILDGSDDCLEWYKLAVNLKAFTPQINFGLHHALQFKPEQVIFCLKNKQIKPLSSVNYKNINLKDLSSKLKLWSSSFNILAYSLNTTFDHPLLRGKLNVLSNNNNKVTIEKLAANPPLNSRPTSISATDFNLLMQDPYGYYAKHILKLKQLERVGVDKFAKEFGIAVHKLIEIYLKNEDYLHYLENLTLTSPKILWFGRMLRIIEWIKQQIFELKPINIECEKELKTLLLGSVLLKSRVDALIVTGSGNLIVNFKTGTPPTKSEVASGYSPQLLVEMFCSHNINLTQGEIWQLKGTTPSGTVSVSIAMPIEIIRNNLEKVISHYLLDKKPFLTCPWPLKKSKYSEYSYLERLTSE